jgi:uncharacterized membrane protein
MLADLMKLFGRIVERFKKRAYGRTFVCPVCHLELSFADLDAHGLAVCPVCGAVLSVEAPYGHPVPVVMDMEINRAQPKARLHPLAAHLPVGLFPFALLGALALLAFSAAGGTALRVLEALGGSAATLATLERVTLLLLGLSVALSPLTIAAGYWDWRHRYGSRPYRIIRLKLAFSGAFVALGAVALALHASGAVFSPSTGLVAGGSPLHALAALSYFAALALGMIVIATLGHVGGNLVFGK